jgi:hypothetical protein
MCKIRDSNYESRSSYTVAPNTLEAAHQDRLSQAIEVETSVAPRSSNEPNLTWLASLTSRLTEPTSMAISANLPSKL